MINSIISTFEQGKAISQIILRVYSGLFAVDFSRAAENG